MRHSVSSSCYLFSLASSFCSLLWMGGSGQQQQGRQWVLVQRVWEWWAWNCTQHCCHLMALLLHALQEGQRKKGQ